MKLDPQQAAAREQFDKQSFRYGSSHQTLSDVTDLKDLLPHIPIPLSNAKALDIATGGGHAALFLVKMGCEVIASDISESMLETASRLAAAEGFFIHTRQHPAEELPYPAESFAIVSCRVAPHHFTDPALFVKEAARVLMPGGFFLMIDSSVPDSPEAAEWLNQVEKLRDPSHVRLISPTEWLSFCGEAGLEPTFWRMTSFKQPDLEEYFRIANTSSANRKEVLRLIDEASPAIRDIYRISTEEAKITWFWPRLGLIAQKPTSPDSAKV